MLAKLGGCIALAGMAAVTAGIYLALDRPVRSVEVVGALLPAEAADVERRLTEFKPSRLLSTDLRALRNHLLELPWPRSVQIRRLWPDTIEIRITRNFLVAKWGALGHLTATGELVRGLEREPEVPVFDCAVASPREALETYRHLQDIASEDGLEIRALAQNAFGEWQLTLSNGVRAHLGADLLRSRVQRFLRLHRHLAEVNPKAVRYFDLRYTHGAAVRFEEPVMLAER